jgi:hypothetical protein
MVLNLWPPFKKLKGAWTCHIFLPTFVQKLTAQGFHLMVHYIYSITKNLVQPKPWWKQEYKEKRYNETKPCIFIHGSGIREDGNWTTEFREYWGNLDGKPNANL